ncbi:hypothetical protein C8R43DRAFT_907629 [Mycena crocata]|nr:hypothetical protein C8R43DRAFT_907629 [Mycena crocata]
MGEQRSFTANRLRSHPDLFDCTKQLSSQEEHRQFRELIGYRPTKKNPDKFYYDSTNVPILHKDYADKYDPTKFFLHESLFITHAAVTCGPATARAMKAGLAPPKVQSAADLWSLWCTEPGMVAAAAIWLRWVNSVDDTFGPAGAASGISWQEDFEYVLPTALDGGTAKKEAEHLEGIPHLGPEILSQFRALFG